MDDFNNNPFKKGLQGLKCKKAAAKNKAAAPKPAAKLSAPPSEDDDTLFAQAMTGVKKIKSAGRDLPKPAPPAQPKSPAESSCDDQVADELKRLLSGHIDFDLTHSDEYVQGAVHGLDSRHLRKLAAGSLAVEAHLDLHGMNLEQAQESLLFFIRESYLQGKRCVLIVTGRGLRSPGGQGIIKSHTQDWLTRVPLKRVVLAFATAQPRHGGAGALYVLLRKRKKMPGQGKVAWERTLFGF